MTISEFVESKTYKNIMKYVYGWGASVVLLGALFKIQHYPGASAMLVAGMGTEVMIFFLSAFEPLHEEVDWTLVYPELAGMASDIDDDVSRDYRPRRDSRLFDVSQLPPPGVVSQHGTSAQEAGGQVQQQQGGAQPVQTQATSAGSGGAKSFALERFDELLEKAELGPDLFVKMGEGIERLAHTAEGLNQMQNVVDASNGFATNLNGASDAVQQLSETYTGSNDVVQNATSSLSEASLKAAGKIEETGINISESTKKSSEAIVNAATTAANSLVDSAKSSSEMVSHSYQQMLEQLDANVKGLQTGSKTYVEQVELQNKHLTALNSMYELQMQQVSQQNEQSGDLFSKASEAIENMSAAVDDTQKYRDELNKLNDNLASLNDVYGNMLSSFNLKND
ncbi:MAG: gliding motility protein GldL [Salinivirgaceae bacterium]|jgi:gliding motility-associated protein GldL|nr:gliding motility protein GldL [Salinivirgaceae bacterium]